MTSSEDGSTAASPVPEAARFAAMLEPAPARHADTPVEPRERSPVVIRAWRRMRSEPSLLFTVAYLFVSFIGLWANFWFYRGFGLPILEYMQASDYLVAGLRDPAYALALLGSIALSLLISGPDIYARRHPERVAAWRARWWGRMVFPRNRWLRWKGVGVTPETGVAAAVFWVMMWATVFYVEDKGEYIRAGRMGSPVRVTMAGERAPLTDTARLLGSSGAFVFLWWPHSQAAEAVPIESIAKLQALPLHPARSAPAKAARAGPASATATLPAAAD